MDYFLDNPDINFKATVVLNKNLLNHKQYNAGSHNNFYYKMFYYTLRDFLQPDREYRIYLDYMDTLGSKKAKKLCDVLKKGAHFELPVSTTIIQSYESQIIQLCDLLIGAISYKNRDDIKHSSIIKQQIITYLEQKLCHQLDYATPQWEEKFNIFRFSPRGTQC